MQQFQQLLTVNKNLREEFQGLLVELKQSVRDLSNFNREAVQAVTEIENAITTGIPSARTA